MSYRNILKFWLILNLLENELLKGKWNEWQKLWLKKHRRNKKVVRQLETPRKEHKHVNSLDIAIKRINEKHVRFHLIVFLISISIHTHKNVQLWSKPFKCELVFSTISYKLSILRHCLNAELNYVIFPFFHAWDRKSVV